LSDDDGPDIFEEADLENRFEEDSEPEEEPADVVFDNGKGFVPKSDSDKISQQGFYGTRMEDGRVELNPIEVLHLLERKRIIVRNVAGDLMHSKDIVNETLPDDSDLWVRYLVFRDLRSRGYAVRQGFGGGIGFRVYARGERPGVASANQLIYVLREGVPISLSDLDLVTDSASAARKKLVFALVDRNGEVNYYKVSQSTLGNRGGQEQ
jgi:tRNA-intron endonuclease